jgi:hypothetical protein
MPGTQRLSFPDRCLALWIFLAMGLILMMYPPLPERGMIAGDQAGLPVSTDADALLHGDCACVMRSRKDRAARS